MDRLSGLDASFLYFETPAHLMHVCGLLVLDPVDHAGRVPLRQRCARRLRRRLESNPAFTRKLHNPLLNLDHPVWVDDDDFDIEHHVRRIAVPAPGGQRELAEVCGDIAGQPLDRSRPLWEFWVIEGLADGAIAVMTKMHHATVDGVSGASLVSDLCSLEPDAPPMAQPEQQRAGATRRATATSRSPACVGIAKRPVKLARLLPRHARRAADWVQRARRGAAMPAPFTAPRTSFNGTVTGHRSIAFTAARASPTSRRSRTPSARP